MSPPVIPRPAARTGATLLAWTVSPNKEGTQHRHDGVMRPFDQASLVEFVRRADGPPEAVSGVHSSGLPGCFSTNLMTGCAARVRGRRSRRRGSYFLIRDRQHWHRCRA